MSEHYSIPENVSLGNQPKTRRGKKTLDKILAAAEEVFGEKGYYEASVTEIAQRAGIATGTFYLYFEEKKGGISSAYLLSQSLSASRN